MGIKQIMLDVDSLAQVLCLSESSIRTLINRGDFPRARKMTDRRVCWLVAEVEAWAVQRPIADMVPVC